METHGCTAVVIGSDRIIEPARAYAREDARFCVAGEFADTGQALHFLMEHPVDLLLVDFDAQGSEAFLKTVLEDEIDADVIVMTAKQDGETLKKALYLGAQDYLIAPVSAQRLRVCVEGYLERLQITRGFKTADQETVDRLLHCVKSPGAAQGGNGRADRVLQCFSSRPDQDLTVKKISEELGFSTVTVRRYLKQLADAGRIVSDVDYNTGGHPRIVYRLP